MPLSCDCYPGCWGDHSENWSRFYGQRSIEELRRSVPYGSYVVCDDHIRVEPGFLGTTEVPPRTLNDYAAEVHDANQKWWHDLETGAPIQRNVGELLMLCTSELAEAMEGHRKGLKDDKPPHRDMFEVELADCVIRILDICGGFGLDLEGAYREKMAFNAIRKDHKPENRRLPGGKKY